jgi:hypothetical protein
MDSSTGSLISSFIGQNEWKTFYARGSPLQVQEMERGTSALLTNFKRVLWQFQQTSIGKLNSKNVTKPIKQYER